VANKPPARKRIRRALLLRDKYICLYCEKILTQDEVTVEHILPGCFGGKTNHANCDIACEECNKLRGQLVEMVFFIENFKIQPKRYREKVYWKYIYRIGTKFEQFADRLKVSYYDILVWLEQTHNEYLERGLIKCSE
jgi:hypothetical protein